MNSQNLYSQRGVSAQKEDVHKAIENLSKGLYEKSFCKIVPDYLLGDPNFVNVMHADGAGTKSILAYLYWKETGDTEVWKNIAQDAVVMNLDDLLCVGIYDNILFSSTIDRNKNKIPPEVLKAIIDGTNEFFETLKSFGVHIHYLGGETADVGDVVRTIAVNGTMTARQHKSKIITNEKIAEGDAIIGLASYGQATYETHYNSGIGSNGLTSARHDVLQKMYAKNYPESFDGDLNNDVVYIGKHLLTEEIKIENTKTTIGKLLLSPTRTFAPVIKNILENNFSAIHGLIHCSGGGQTKCLKFIHDNLAIVKNNLFSPPEIFNIIQANSGADDSEMYQVFNMGTRMEIYTEEKFAEQIIEQAKQFNIPAQIIGRVEKFKKQRLIIKTERGEIGY